MISFFKYVPVGFVHVWEREGWEVASGPNLHGIHHGQYALLMKAGPNCKYKEDGEPMCPAIAA